MVSVYDDNDATLCLEGGDTVDIRAGGVAAEADPPVGTGLVENLPGTTRDKAGILYRGGRRRLEGSGDRYSWRKCRRHIFSSLPN